MKLGDRVRTHYRKPCGNELRGDAGEHVGIQRSGRQGRWQAASVIHVPSVLKQRRDVSDQEADDIIEGSDHVNKDNDGGPFAGSVMLYRLHGQVACDIRGTAS